MQEDVIILRPLLSTDIDAAIQLSVDAGWNQTENDWKFMIGDAKNICVAAVWNEKVIGTTIALHYSDELDWIGMVLVDKQYRGRGISKLLLQHIFEKCSAVVKLDATTLGEPVYRKFGFLPEYTIARMVTAGLKGIHSLYDQSIQQALPAHIGGILSLEERVFGVERNNLMTYYMQQYPHKFRVQQKDNVVTGFISGRDGYCYHHIGPVIAASANAAAALINQALEKLAGQPVVIDVLYDKHELIQLLESYGFFEQRRFVRMYKEQNITTGDAQQLFAIAGPEFG